MNTEVKDWGSIPCSLDLPSVGACCCRGPALKKSSKSGCVRIYAYIYDVYMCVCVCICVYICICMYMYVYIYIYMSLYRMYVQFVLSSIGE